MPADPPWHGLRQLGQLSQLSHLSHLNLRSRTQDRVTRVTLASISGWSDEIWKILKDSESDNIVSWSRHEKHWKTTVRLSSDQPSQGAHNLTWPMGGSILAHQPTGSTGLNSWIEPSKLFHGWPTLAIGPWWSEDLFFYKVYKKIEKLFPCGSMWFHLYSNHMNLAWSCTWKLYRIWGYSKIEGDDLPPKDVHAFGCHVIQNSLTFEAKRIVEVS